MKDGLSLRQQQLPLIMYYITVADPDLQIRGVGGGGGKGVSKKIFSAFQASVWSKNKGEGSPALDPPLHNHLSIS